MNNQNFVGNIGFGSKGYSILPFKKKINAIFISGLNGDYKYIYKKIVKLYKINIPYLKINKQRNNINSLDNLIKKLQNKKINCIFVSGGGSVIDCVKYLVLNLKLKSKYKIEFYIIPSKIGSGAESSMASIINTKYEKLINVDSEFLPDGIIYDYDFLQKLSKKELLLGSLDAICHCIESIFSANKNDYVDFISINTLNYFLSNININTLLKKDNLTKNDIIMFSLLSLNGGIAQNNAGSCIFHALAHSTEKLIKLKHSICIAFFILPALNFYTKSNQKLPKMLNPNFYKYIKRIIFFLNKDLDFNNIKKTIIKKNNFNKIIEIAKQDPCWRLYKENVKVDILKNSITKFKI